ncbi:unnamed protein product [Periconia digitata]|uniref:Uncharacterized protein n=1 Tax=Periconia digitata TaxID=1303443 RepID=A0A9W4UJ42_9PLEO|nr:unnamed protein product [Periconia digitata]
MNKFILSFFLHQFRRLPVFLGWYFASHTCLPAPLDEPAGLEVRREALLTRKLPRQTCVGRRAFFTTTPADDRNCQKLLVLWDRISDHSRGRGCLPASEARPGKTRQDKTRLLVSQLPQPAMHMCRCGRLGRDPEYSVPV